jgi:hypothetical protein
VGSRNTITEVETQHESLARSILYRSSDVRSAWNALPEEKQSEQAVRIIFLVAFLRCGAISEAHALVQPFLEEIRRIEVFREKGRRWTTWLSFLDRFRLKGIRWIYLRWLSRQASVVSADVIFASIYYLMWTRQQDALGYSLSWYALAETGGTPDLPRAKWFHGFLASLNGFYDHGDEYVRQGVEDWDARPLSGRPWFHGQWLTEAKIVRSATAFFQGDPQLSLSCYEQALEALPSIAEFPFAYVYGLSVRLRTGLFLFNIPVIEECLITLKRILGSAYDIRFALHAHSATS